MSGLFLVRFVTVALIDDCVLSNPGFDVVDMPLGPLGKARSSIMPDVVLFENMESKAGLGKLLARMMASLWAGDICVGWLMPLRPVLGSGDESDESGPPMLLENGCRTSRSLRK